MKGFSSKRLALKTDVIRPENILFAGADTDIDTDFIDIRP